MFENIIKHNYTKYAVLILLILIFSFLRKFRANWDGVYSVGTVLDSFIPAVLVIIGVIYIKGNPTKKVITGYLIVLFLVMLGVHLYALNYLF